MTEERVSRLEGAYEQVDQRLGDLTQAGTALRQEMSELSTSLRQEMREQGAALRQEMREQNTALRSEVNSRINALLVVGAGAWVTTVGLIIGLYLQS